MGQEREGKLAQVMQEGRMREEGDTSRLMAELNARREMGTEERGSRERISQNELASRVAAAEAERAGRATEGGLDRASRERIASMPARQQVTSPSQQGNQFENRLQQLAIDVPGAAKVLTKDPDTGRMIFKPGTTPEQMEFVKNYLSQRGIKKPDQKPNPPVKPMTSRDK